MYRIVKVEKDSGDRFYIQKKTFFGWIYLLDMSGETMPISFLFFGLSFFISVLMAFLAPPLWVVIFDITLLIIGMILLFQNRELFFYEESAKQHIEKLKSKKKTKKSYIYDQKTERKLKLKKLKN